MTFNSQQYDWAGTDSKIVGDTIGSNPYGLAIGGLIAATGTLHNLNSNLAYRNTTGCDIWPVTLPSQWATTLFQPVTTDSSRSVLIMGINYSKQHKLFMGAEGDFVSEHHPVDLNRLYLFLRMME